LGIPAAFGTLRFAGVRALIPAHKLFTALATHCAFFYFGVVYLVLFHSSHQTDHHNHHHQGQHEGGNDLGADATLLKFGWWVVIADLIFFVLVRLASISEKLQNLVGVILGQLGLGSILYSIYPGLVRLVYPHPPSSPTLDHFSTNDSNRDVITTTALFAVGAVAALLMSVGIGATGRLRLPGGFATVLRVDLFHYGMAIATFAFYRSLQTRLFGVTVQ